MISHAQTHEADAPHQTRNESLGLNRRWLKHSTIKHWSNDGKEQDQCLYHLPDLDARPRQRFTTHQRAIASDAAAI